ncbi:phosphoadenylyl-sulfate reductase [Synechococcus sp. CCY 9618]|uniref:phosphoadenylyl-sulfate reductase n=1 Tax=Synechococcus sp. CCY 9618 TaxID=2815602 RepID=UPI001C2165A8|nr:phosphoadenylyl-sulfate reductase [Synechococcus sp. CCY 9618]
MVSFPLTASPGPEGSAVGLDPALRRLPRDRHGSPIDLVAARSGLAPLDALARMRWAHETFAGHFAVTTSFGIQSAVMLHMVSRLGDAGSGPPIPVLWVDTGYLPPETYRYADELGDRLRLDLHVLQAGMSPARMEALHGRLWESGQLEDMRTYNRLRKVEPLDRALEQLDVHCWASGVRSGQTEHRGGMHCLDPVRERWSLRPLLTWTRRDVYYYMQEHDLPQHPLFEQGYSTVGDWHSSAPDDGTTSGRATRFNGLQQECGIHLPGLMGEGI